MPVADPTYRPIHELLADGTDPPEPRRVRLFELLEALAEDRCRGWPLAAADVDAWLDTTKVTWNELVDWMFEQAFRELTATASETQPGRQLLARLCQIISAVPQFGRLLSSLDIVAGETGYGPVCAELLARLSHEFQAAADQGVAQADLEALLRFWAETRGAAVTFVQTAGVLAITAQL